MGTVSKIVDTARNPEYTGENRCVPCTVVNVTIAVLLATVLVAVAWPIDPAIAAATGMAVLVVGLGATYLRGYVVPGTPTVTRRYFPDWLLRWFDKRPEPGLGTDTAAPEPETVLIDAGAIDECDREDDLCLTDGFQSAWQREMEEIRGAGAEDHVLASVLGVEEDALGVREYGDAFAVHADGRRVGQWESRAALIADLAAARALGRRYAAWDAMDVAHQGRVLYGLRIFLKACPACGTPVNPGMETTKSCCREIEVVAIECDECGSRLLERELPG